MPPSFLLVGVRDEFDFAGFEAADSANVWQGQKEAMPGYLGGRKVSTEEVPAGQFF